jgi:hypothetical protein
LVGGVEGEGEGEGEGERGRGATATTLPAEVCANLLGLRAALARVSSALADI